MYILTTRVKQCQLYLLKLSKLIGKVIYHVFRNRIQYLIHPREIFELFCIGWHIIDWLNWTDITLHIVQKTCCWKKQQIINKGLGGYSLHKSVNKNHSKTTEESFHSNKWSPLSMAVTLMFRSTPAKKCGTIMVKVNAKHIFY